MIVKFVVKLYLNDKINCRNGKSSQKTESEITIRYFNLLFIGLNSKHHKRKLNNFEEYITKV